MDPTEAYEAVLGTPDGRADPYPLYEAMRTGGPVLRHGPDSLVMVGYAACDQVLRDARLPVHDVAFLDTNWPEWDEHSSIRALARSILQTNSPDHERVRRLVSGTFTPRRLASMHAAIRRLAGDLADRMDGVGVVDFMSEFAYLLPVNVICELLGVPERDRAWFRPVAHEMTSTLEPMEADLPVADAASDEMAAYFTSLIEARRVTPADDLISALVATHDADPGVMSAEELLSNVTLLLLAGFETTTNLLGNGLWTLLSRPAALAGLRTDPSLVDAYVEEMLRFDAPVQLTTRRTDVETEVFGEVMPPGAELVVLFGAANRDPRRFTRPDEFDPGRTGNTPLSFGAGPHFCLGAALARMEARIAFPLLLARFPALAPAAEPVRKDRITLRGYASMPISV